MATKLFSNALCIAALALATQHAHADDDEHFGIHGQFTYVEQETSSFNAPYRGANSLSPDRGAETTDATLYLGARAWQGAEVWLNGELDQGHGLDDTLGVAGFPSGEAYKVGKNQPYFRLQRLFLRQTINLSTDRATVEGAANQLRAAQSNDRIVLTLGKFSVVDVFDVSHFAHDPRSDFLNWTAIDTGSFDYAADAWGYTVGAALEWYQGPWTLRGGFFDLSDVPNSVRLEPGFHEYQIDAEVEYRHAIADHPGRILITAFNSHGRMGLLSQATAAALLTGTPADLSAIRQVRSRAGISAGLEQEIVADLTAFLRIGKAGGNVESYEFTDVDRTLAVGLSLQGASWRRPHDTVGLVAINNNASAARQQFLAAGGLGILVGDGRLSRPGPEQIVETYYCATLFRALQLSIDYQYINHPAYNRDRGPVSALALRLHAQF